MMNVHDKRHERLQARKRVFAARLRERLGTPMTPALERMAVSMGYSTAAAWVWVNPERGYQPKPAVVAAIARQLRCAVAELDGANDE